MSDLRRILNVASQIRRERLAGVRLKIMLPILLLFLPGMAWGFSDPNIVLPGGHRPDTSMEVLFYASLGVVFGATMCAVLMAFDGVSKDRASGMLEVRLAQPMPRRHQATALIIGHAQSILVPVYLLLAAAVLVVRFRMGEWPTVVETLVYGLSTGLIVLWYTLFALLASTSAREQGTAIAFGIGVWFFFTFLWALVTTMVAYASGVAVGEANDPAWVTLEGMLDLLSPNGVYHHLLETQLPTVDRGVAPWQSWMAAAVWTFAPWWALHRRMERLVP
ncbi:MAG: ABC transporter permease subunit [Candidatus Thermoplasmatota archaeon]|nr:ABC transporter permease subunit [Candidatus Thermoplasmatota archaeon]MEC7443673.1 ABC transporter permease subunit [Candidatus Thermoplasmatota archaeon]MEC7461614.1 ABC transporter permease subunit [Candidatus Thermoplasmatota archaeon]MEC7600278.1 ABC transporter permease subunit [Candidatus Thermoplasmatota archaeon]MEC7626206.1 ABC transporter permease subunit [Candidatus Thermoplasmatota archaeon]